MVMVFFVFADLLDNPANGGAERLVKHRSAGFADGFQTTEGPFVRTILPQLTHEQAVRQHDQVHVPGLALAVAKLTISHAKLLLTVPMIGLRARPAISIGTHDATHFPRRSVADENLARFGIAAMIPNDDDPNLVVHFGDMQRTGEAPLPMIAASQWSALVASVSRAACSAIAISARVPMPPGIRKASMSGA